ncbi:expressed protein [Batrachochytrium dendrobatidis JAM81]|uniref:Expressed protein n=1 Tax=Batrachochytrium dendrobatidis (strain JAM81 / FGSC 10211) TaxID=684364 RepID=F4NST1_BATDJ|nr:uncharacterized protein BATDEDRAFT_36365 [Batrachochytrium dendrobatidis JAM81]EGF83843.1 expressed protein [Batrachochytrium dendrobatidis JAM81]|eukprot:XP_006675838.1 expressed protein [Batrachochytrium dendrobatidis JAM81]
MLTLFIVAESAAAVMAASLTGNSMTTGSFMSRNTGRGRVPTKLAALRAISGVRKVRKTDARRSLDRCKIFIRLFSLNGASTASSSGLLMLCGQLTRCTVRLHVLTSSEFRSKLLDRRADL